MKSIATAIALSILTTTSAHAEARSSEGALQTPAADRQSKYSGESAPPVSAQEKKHGVAKPPAPITYRDANAKLSSRTGAFSIYDASATLRRDRDNDGYHSEFQVRFDADVVVGDARVYAKLYIRRVGDTGAWRYYHTTDDFWIYGQSGSDDYFVTTTLDDGFATADYDVLIDLYEVGYSGIVATLSGFEDDGLAFLPLEESGLDVPVQLSGYAIDAVSTALVIDDDGDGYYSRFRVAFDPDSDVGATYAYAVIWVRANGGEWIREHESDDFLVHGSGAADTYSITADWLSGYPTAEYDVQIDLFDSASNLLIASAGSERPELSRLPLEDETRDRVVGGPGGGGGTVVITTTHEGGGAMAWWLIGLLGLLGVRRWR